MQEEKKPYFTKLMSAYSELKKSHQLFPPEPLTFNAFNYFDLAQLKVIILGQDPYYTLGYANGLAFAVNADQPTPKSLQNIFKEVVNEYGVVNADKTLISWAKQGVLLLNTSLCVINNQPNSCKDLGWTFFVKDFIAYCNENAKHLVYLLWGNNAINFKKEIDEKNNLVLTSSHPSPLSCKGFFYNQHFKLCNQYLQTFWHTCITW